MDNRDLLQKLTKSFNRNDLTLFFQTSGKFKPEKDDYRHFLQKDNFVKDLVKLGKIDFNDSRRLVLLVGEVDKELTSHSGKLKQYDIAKKVLKDGYVDAGIFIFHDDAGHFRFSLITAQYTGTKKEYSNFRRYTYFISHELPAHTFITQIGTSDFSSIEKITEAFSVEPVTNEFFKEYRKVFEEAEATINLKWTADKKRLYTQRFFNRLMFLAFLERKGWLVFDKSSNRKDYLRTLYADYHANEDNKRNANFHKSRLNTLFFRGLNNPHGDQLSTDPEYKVFKRLIGDVPYLNGGLFEEEADDIDGFTFPDTVVAKILTGLIYQFNFTVTESTPLDVEVAVDPEMLGRIFEELVTGRHESGSYYTVKPVVAFMCYEALASYLQSALPSENQAAIIQFVYQKNPSELRNPEAVLEALRAVKVCDPACGSGAYLLGMLHVLLELRECLFATRSLDAKTVYERKLEIIQNNLYGVDKDDFAVNIARLRLWLSLIVDYEGETPPPLPNLDFKIETGDSLTASDPSGGLQPDMFRYGQVQEFLRLKNEFMSIHAGSEKKKELDKQIMELRAKIKEWAHPKGYDLSSDSFDWQVDFAEVFAPELAESTLSGKLAGVINTTKGQMELTTAPKEGGFDIVLANPPYVRHELLGNYKEELKPIYPEVYNGTADLYVYFYARAHQLLRNGGVACFISSNKWLKAGYGEKLRQHLLDKHAFHLVADFGDLPVFQNAMAYPCIFLWQKMPRAQLSTFWAEIKDLQACYEEGIREHISRIAVNIPASEFGANKPRLSKFSSSTYKTKLTLKDLLLNGMQILSGIKTGLNEAFVIDQDLRDEFVSKHKGSIEILKPLLVGEDVRSYEIHFKNQYLIWSYTGIDITKFPPIFDHLKKFKLRLEQRTDQFTNWWELRPCDYYDLFDKPKIIYPQVLKEPRFFLDKNGYFTNQKCYFFPLNDFFVLGLLNSYTVWQTIRENSPILQGGYSEPRRDFMLTLPIPDVPQSEHKAVAKLAEQTQSLHTQRRKRVEKFLREIGIEPAESTSRNPLEQPWSLTAEEFTRRVGQDGMKAYKSAHEETMAVTEDIVRVEKEIDERVKSLYGL
jgi:type I restriction-modification system DNA methylase subunit